MNALSINDCIEQLIPLSQRYLGQEASENQIIKLNDHINRDRACIMVFGAYNAGKSSLINALRGNNDAKTNDIPTTDSVTQYEWRNCYLLDTPGINAPIAHQNVTEHELKASQLILFVIREGDHDTASIYSKIMDMVKKEKQVFIVFNHQLELGDLGVALEKMNMNLESFRKKDGGVSKEQIDAINVLPINIKTALTANEQSLPESSLLLERHSGIAGFKEAFREWYQQYDTKTHHLNGIKNTIKECLIEPINTAISSKNTSQGELDALLLEKAKLEGNMSDISFSIANTIRAEAQHLESTIEHIVRDSNGKNVTEAVEHEARPMANVISTSLQGELNQASIHLTTPNPEIDDLDPLEETSKDQTSLLNISQIVVGLPPITNLLERVFLKWVPILPIVTELFRWYESSQQEKRKQEEQAARERNIHQSANNAAREIKRSLNEQVETIITDFFKPALDEINHLIDDLKKDMSQVQKDAILLNEIASKVERLSI